MTQSQTRELISIHHLKKYYGSFLALSIDHLSISEGSCVFLTGHSGAGKSTFLSILTCALRPSSGICAIAGLDLRTLPAHQYYRYRQKIGIISQNPPLLAHRSVFDNVAMPLLVRGYAIEEIAPMVFSSLESTKIAHLADKKPATLSTGEQQRVGIARALVHQPVLVIADEPTGHLDPELSLEILSLFTRLQTKGCTFIIATHDIANIHLLSQKSAQPSVTLVLKHGTLIPPASVYPLEKAL